VMTVFMHYGAWTLPKRWSPIIAKSEAILRESDREAKKGNECSRDYAAIAGEPISRYGALTSRNSLHAHNA
jgi:hypothetical protein